MVSLPGKSRLAQTGLAALLVGALAIAADIFLPSAPAPALVGIVWQPDNQTVGIRGDWQKLGVHDLLVQWTAVDGQSFVPGAGLPEVPVLPDWSRIGKEPWAQKEDRKSVV